MNAVNPFEEKSQAYTRINSEGLYQFMRMSFAIASANCKRTESNSYCNRAVGGAICIELSSAVEKVQIYALPAKPTVQLQLELGELHR